MNQVLSDVEREALRAMWAESGPRLRVLFADADPLVRRAAVKSLSTNFDVAAVASSQEAILSCVTGQFDVVVASRELQDLDGATLLKEVSRRWPKIRRVLVTREIENESKTDGNIAVRRSSGVTGIFDAIDPSQFDLKSPRRKAGKVAVG